MAKVFLTPGSGVPRCPDPPSYKLRVLIPDGMSGPAALAYSIKVLDTLGFGRATNGLRLRRRWRGPSIPVLRCERLRLAS
jgi:hypothetical protein